MQIIIVTHSGGYFWHQYLGPVFTVWENVSEQCQVLQLSRAPIRGGQWCKWREGIAPRSTVPSRSRISGRSTKRNQGCALLTRKALQARRASLLIDVQVASSRHVQQQPQYLLSGVPLCWSLDLALIVSTICLFIRRASCPQARAVSLSAPGFTH